MDIEVNHHVYDLRFRCLHGEGILGIEDLLFQADQISGRERCYFFQAVGDKFVVGFLTEREDAHRAGEYFFNIFSMNLENAKKARLGDIITKLNRRSIKHPDEEIEITFKVSVNEEFYDYPLIVAQMYKDFVNEHKVYAPLDYISVFKSRVGDALNEMKFLSIENKKADILTLWKETFA